MKKTILYFYPNDASFVRKDLAILESEYIVRCFKFEAYPKWKTPLLWLQQLVFLLVYLPKTDIVITQFAGYHSFLPNLISKWFEKPSLMILGGTECASFPSVNYGAYRKKLLGSFTRWSFKLAKHLSPVHESMVLYKYNYWDKDYPYQGFEFFNGKLNASVTTIYNGFEPEKFYNKNEIRKRNSFITVSVKLSGMNYQLKGIDLIIEAAKNFPEGNFTIIGNDFGYIQNIPNNVKIIPPVPNHLLVDLLNQHEFYLQLSISEGFPNALGEGMMCGCIPIGSDVSSIPYIIADTGFVLKKRDPKLLLNILHEAINCDKEELSARASSRILQEYPINKRKTELLNLVNRIAN